jgi:hypothetical protein
MFNEKAPATNNNQEGERLIVNESNEVYDRAFDSPSSNQKEQKNDSLQQVPNTQEVSLEKRELKIKDSDIHHMPDKFLKPEGKPKKEKNIFIILGIILGVIVIGIVAAFAFFALQGGEVPENNEVLNLNENITPSEEMEAIDSEEMNLVTAQGRDEKRIKDILDIRSALSFYYQDIEKYPYQLSSLKKYLPEVPKNPEPRGEDYYYKVDDDGSVYSLTFVLEEGVELDNLVLSSGKYELTPNFGISAYIDISEPEVEPEIVEPEPENDPGSGLLPIPKIGNDNDNDGLTNIEELLFGTKFGLPDSDFDGYIDSEELIALYDPLTDGAMLIDNSEIVSVYDNEIFNYSVLYPAKWLVEEKTVDFKEVIFYDDENGDFFKIQIIDNPQGLSIQEWYSYFSPGSSLSNLEYFENGNLVGVKTKDGLNIYISSENQVYIISYIIINTEELNYSKTFEMFSNSFKMIES